jgi:hypothetical protein
MSQLDSSVALQSGATVPLVLKITASTDPTVRIDATSRDSISFAGSANFCRPHS